MSVICLLAFSLLALTSTNVFAADTKIDFVFSRNVVEFKRDKSSNNVSQTPTITISGVSNPEVVTGFSAKYIRTHGGDGARLKRNDAATTSPSLAGTYSVAISFEADVPFVCINGLKTQEYAAAFIIKRAKQSPPTLRSASPYLTNESDKKSGYMEVGSSAIISVAWSSGLKPILTWTAGSNAVVTPEQGKPARFTAKAVGTAVLTALLPEDNNYIASETAIYTVNVTGSTLSSSFYDLKGSTKNKSGWYTGNVSIIGKNGFDNVVAESEYPISTDGNIEFRFALENDSGGKTNSFSVNIKKDSTPPIIDNLRINDSPFVDAPEDNDAAWAADSDLVITADIFDTASGIARLEYRVDASDYISDENIAFKTEGCSSHEFSLTVENTGHILWLRATDTAGNVSVRDYLLPAGTTDTSDSQSSSQSTATIITEPTKAMIELTERLAHLRICNIEAQVIGDVRANQGYIELTLEMFKALSVPERIALGDDLAVLRSYFDMLYLVQGKDKAELDTLFVLELEEPESVSQSISQSTVSSTSQSIEDAPLVTSNSAHSDSSSAAPVVSETPPSQFSFIYLVPLLAAIAAVVMYFVWKKKLAPSKAKFELPLSPTEDEPFTGFSDMDE